MVYMDSFRGDRLHYGTQYLAVPELDPNFRNYPYVGGLRLKGLGLSISRYVQG